MNQAGLSWQTILNKMSNFDQAYDHFDIETVANYSEEKILALMDDPGIIRNRRKIEAAVHNAQLVLAIQQEIGSFSDFYGVMSTIDPSSIIFKHNQKYPSIHQFLIAWRKI